MSNVPDGSRFLLGDGKLLIDKWTGSPLARTNGFRFLGDIEKLTVNATIEVKKAFEHSDGARTLINSGITKSEFEIACDMKEMTRANLALSMQGDDTVYFTQAGGSVVAEVHAEAATNGLDRYVQTAQRRISAVTVKGGATGTTVLTAGTDYVIENAEMGLIYIPATSSFNPATDTMKIDYTAAAIAATALPRMNAGVKPGAIATLQFIPYPASVTPLIEVMFWKVRILPDGDNGLITDDYGVSKFKASCLLDGVNPGFARYLFKDGSATQ